MMDQVVSRWVIYALTGYTKKKAYFPRRLDMKLPLLYTNLDRGLKSKLINFFFSFLLVQPKGLCSELVPVFADNPHLDYKDLQGSVVMCKLIFLLSKYKIPSDPWHGKSPNPYPPVPATARVAAIDGVLVLTLFDIPVSSIHSIHASAIPLQIRVVNEHGKKFGEKTPSSTHFFSSSSITS